MKTAIRKFLSRNCYSF